MKERKTYRKIDYCLRVVDHILMKTIECDPKEIANVWYHTKDILVIGKNHVRLTKDKTRNMDYVVGVSRTENICESADKLYTSTKPKGGPRCHKKKPASTESGGIVDMIATVSA